MSRHVTTAFILAGSLLAVQPAFADDLTGIWLRDTGASKVKFGRCGDALCGTIVWLKEGADPKAKVGQRVFFGMKPNGAMHGPGARSIPRTARPTAAR